MQFIDIIVMLIITGFFLYVIKTITFVDGWVKNIIYGVVCIALLLYLLRAFGLWSGFKGL